MSRQRLALPIVGGASLLGAVLYFRSRPNKSYGEQTRDRKLAKQEQGIMGAGVGNTHAIGGHEPGQSDKDSSRKVETTAPKEKLPSGGVGGGEASPRDINFPGLDKGQIGRDEGGLLGRFSRSKPYEQSYEGDKGGQGKGSSGKGTNQNDEKDASQTLSSLFGQGGKSSKDRDDTDRFHDTKIASHQEDTPTNKGLDKRFQ
ncbi:hypothetical protein PT974_01196 [Cladobotryum mycophilum]|uniref:Uncharacterized protein n=1 Tax=Cladobotryum mycophilum TaxID=491253 RepID=A0ABR0T2Z7_9HYPO